MLRKLFQRLTVPMSEVDLARLKEFCNELPGRGADRVGRAPVRRSPSPARSRRCASCPEPGSPSLEATVSDGSGSIVAVWTGRRHLAGVCPGRRLVLSGRGADQNGNGRLVVLNPRYELL